MAKNPFVEEVLARLRPLTGLRAKAMFGGHGLYLSDSFFAVIAGTRLYFRVTAETRPDYEGRGCGPFEYDEGKVMKSYYEVPADVWADPIVLREWAVRAADR